MLEPETMFSDIDALLERARSARGRLPDEGMIGAPTIREMIWKARNQLGREQLSMHVVKLRSIEGKIAAHKSQVKLWNSLRPRLERKLDNLLIAKESFRRKGDNASRDIADRQASGVRDILANFEGGIPSIVVTEAFDEIKAVFGTGQPPHSLYYHITQIEELNRKHADKLGAIESHYTSLLQVVERVEQELETVFAKVA